MAPEKIIFGFVCFDLLLNFVILGRGGARCSPPPLGRDASPYVSIAMVRAAKEWAMANNLPELTGAQIRRLLEEGIIKGV